MNWTCPKCEGEIRFEIVPPDWEVGITGYSAEMQESKGHSWECQCEFTADEVAALEDAVARDYVSYGPIYIEP